MNVTRTLLVATLGFALSTPVVGGELKFGCIARPACGKTCKLVCETKTITQIAYGVECPTICVPGPSKSCGKYCCTVCPSGVSGCDDCCDTDCDCVDECTSTCGKSNCCEKEPVAKFNWRKWMPKSCAKPRTVKKLTKYEVTKEVCSYHWEVVDGHGCCDSVDDDCCDPSCGCVFKTAPADAQIGAVFALTKEELQQVADIRSAIQQPAALHLTSAISLEK